MSLLPQFIYRTQYGNLRSEIDAVNWALYHSEAFKGIAKKKEIPPVYRWGNSAFFVKKDEIKNREILKTMIKILEALRYVPRPASPGQVIRIGGMPQRMWGEIYLFPDSDHEWDDDGNIAPKRKTVPAVSKEYVDKFEKYIDDLERIIKIHAVKGRIADYDTRYDVSRRFEALKKILKQKFGKANTPRWDIHDDISKVEKFIEISRQEIKKAREQK